MCISCVSHADPLHPTCNIPCWSQGLPWYNSGKNPMPVQKMWVQSLVWEDPMQKEMSAHTCMPAWTWPRGQRSLVSYSPWGRKALGLANEQQLKSSKGDLILKYSANPVFTMPITPKVKMFKCSHIFWIRNSFFSKALAWKEIRKLSK